MRLLLLLLCISLVQPAMARKWSMAAQEPMGGDITMNLIRQQWLREQPKQKTTAIQYRFVAWNYRHTDTTTLLDSSHYFYSGNRGSLNNNNVNLLGDNYIPNYYGVYQYGNPLEVQNLFCDSSKLWITQNNVYKLADQRHYQYNSNNQTIYLTDRNTTEYTIGYNTAGKYDSIMVADTFGSGGTGMYVPKNTTHCYYDASQKRIYDSTVLLYGNNPGIWVKYGYVYDAAGNLVERWIYQWNSIDSTWDGINKWLYSYTSNNYLQSAMLQVNSFNQWQNYQVDSFTYTGSTNSLYTFYARYSWDGNQNMWRPPYNNIATGYSINPQGLWDTIYYYRADTMTNGWNIVEKDPITYDNNQLLTKIEGYGYHNGVWDTAPIDSSHYYYESYGTAPTTVAQHSPLQYAIRAYPNPVSQTLHLQVTGELHQEQLHCTIVNMLGQVVFAQTGIADIQMTGWAKGIYALYITDEQARKVYAETIVKE